MAEDHKVIWLEPNCEDLGKDREWCQDDVWEGKCEECGKPSVKYIRADLAVQPAQGASGNDDPTASKEWNEGCDFALERLGQYLSIDLSSISWDGATETVEGDVDVVIGNILRAKFGEDWGPSDCLTPAASERQPSDRHIYGQLEMEKMASPAASDRAEWAVNGGYEFAETLKTPAEGERQRDYDHGYGVGYEHGVKEGEKENARLLGLVESVRRKAQEKSDFWHAQAAKDEAGGGTRAEHYAVVGSQFQNIVSLTSTVRGSDAQT